jgi:hypothetical protein
MPIIRMAPATRKFAAKEPVRSKIIPATMGAAMPTRLLKKFMMLPTVPTVPRGAIKDGMLHPMGAAKARPPRAMEIQMIATLGLVVKAAPITAIPRAMPMVSNVLRTRVGSFPRLMRFTHVHGAKDQEIFIYLYYCNANFYDHQALLQSRLSLYNILSYLYINIKWYLYDHYLYLMKSRASYKTVSPLTCIPIGGGAKCSSLQPRDEA